MAEKGGTKILGIFTICIMLISIGFSGCIGENKKDKDDDKDKEPEKENNRVYYLGFNQGYPFIHIFINTSIVTLANETMVEIVILDGTGINTTNKVINLSGSKFIIDNGFFKHMSLESTNNIKVGDYLYYEYIQFVVNCQETFILNDSSGNIFNYYGPYDSRDIIFNKQKIDLKEKYELIIPNNIDNNTIIELINKTNYAYNYWVPVSDMLVNYDNEYILKNNLTVIPFNHTMLNNFYYEIMIEFSVTGNNITLKPNEQGILSINGKKCKISTNNLKKNTNLYKIYVMDSVLLFIYFSLERI